MGSRNIIEQHLQEGDSDAAYLQAVDIRESQHTMTIRKGTRLYHGTISDFVEQIKQAGKLIPPGVAVADSKASRKVSGGLLTEIEFVWLSLDPALANWYADGVEARNSYTAARGIKAGPGGVFTVIAPRDLKLIDRHQRLSQEQVDVVNTFLPHYKPVKVGTGSLSSAEW